MNNTVIVRKCEKYDPKMIEAVVSDDAGRLSRGASLTKKCLQTYHMLCVIIYCHTTGCDKGDDLTWGVTCYRTTT